MRTHVPEEYEIDTPEDFYARCNAVLVQIYSMYKDAERFGKADHEWLRMMCDAIFHNVLVAEKKVLERSANVPPERPKVHGNSESLTRRMMQAFGANRLKLEEKVKERVGYED